jgi:hypothetical protein
MSSRTEEAELVYAVGFRGDKCALSPDQQTVHLDWSLLQSLQFQNLQTLLKVCSKRHLLDFPPGQGCVPFKVSDKPNDGKHKQLHLFKRGRTVLRVEGSSIAISCKPDDSFGWLDNANGNPKNIYGHCLWFGKQAKISLALVSTTGLLSVVMSVRACKLNAMRTVGGNVVPTIIIAESNLVRRLQQAAPFGLRRAQ